MSLDPPDQVTVSQDLDTLRITFPARTEKTLVHGPEPERPATNNPLVILSILLVYPAIIATFIATLSWSTTVEIMTQLPQWINLMHILIIGIIIAMAARAGGDPPSEAAPLRTTKRSLPAATVELRPHHLVIRSSAPAKSIPLGDIDTVTIDKAGARIRVQGHMHYLLPDRTDTERAWLAELLGAAVQARRAGRVDANEARAQLEKLLQRT